MLFIEELFPGIVIFDPDNALKVPELLTVQSPALNVIGVEVAIKLPELVMVLPLPELKLNVDEVASKLPELVSEDEDPPLMVNVDALVNVMFPLFVIGVVLPDTVMVDAFNEMVAEFVNV